MLFGTSGIRGVVGKEITNELAISVGRALGKKRAKLILCRDSRASGTMLASALSSGAMASGSDVLDIGIAPTPTLALATLRNKCAGAMITASHNPPEYNGIKLFANGMEFSRRLEAETEERISAKKYERCGWNEVGQKREMPEAIRQHIDFCLSLADVDLIKKKKPKILLDCGNGAASTLMPRLLREAGCDLVELNCSPSGEFKRGLEPNEENLKEAALLVKKAGADLGIAHDGDADRAIAIDENGKMLGLDAQLCLMLESELEKSKRKGATIISTVEASLCVRETAERNGAKIKIVPVGSLFVAEELKRSKAVFGGEPCGEYIFSDGLPAADGILAGLKFAELFCRKGKLSQLASKIKTYPMKRAKFPCANEKKKTALERIKSEAKKQFSGKVSDMDGIRIDADDCWLLIRPSGTEPYMRLTCEAKTEKKLAEIFEKGKKLIESAI